MWTLGSGQYGGQSDGWFVALIGLVGGLEVLGALALRFLDGRRRRRGPRSGYS
jgi:uncharacterized membrane-anchored protein YhcB (DUF1043 family)